MPVIKPTAEALMRLATLARRISDDDEMRTSHLLGKLPPVLVKATVDLPADTTFDVMVQHLSRRILVEFSTAMPMPMSAPPAFSAPPANPNAMDIGALRAQPELDQRLRALYAMCVKQKLCRGCLQPWTARLPAAECARHYTGLQSRSGFPGQR
ncbi:hypothetical protein BC828DRAFT_389828 [Blastocladiella britannica]|nr:hypothetical protein BC828DRAFT_389828 [Blastocladiella britannica]